VRRPSTELVCPDCGAGLALDERLSTKVARPVYSCAACGRGWSSVGQDQELVAEQGTADAGSRTVRMRAVKPSAAERSRKPAELTMTLPEGMTVSLEVSDGPGRGKVHHLDRRVVVIGREEGEIQIADPMISRRHASLEIHDFDTIILRDLSSTNGTYHNDQLIAFCKLQDGDEIRLGSTTMTISVDVIG